VDEFLLFVCAGCVWMTIGNVRLCDDVRRCMRAPQTVCGTLCAAHTLCRTRALRAGRHSQRAAHKHHRDMHRTLSPTRPLPHSLSLAGHCPAAKTPPPPPPPSRAHWLAADVIIQSGQICRPDKGEQNGPSSGGNNLQHSPAALELAGPTRWLWAAAAAPKPGEKGATIGGEKIIIGQR